MKLYATTTSERATKGQGGNEHILSVFTAEIDGQRQEILSVAIVNCTQPKYAVTVTMPDKRVICQEVAKGNKQKGEICNFNACKNKAVKYGVCEKHLPLEQ